MRTPVLGAFLMNAYRGYTEKVNSICLIAGPGHFVEQLEVSGVFYIFDMLYYIEAFKHKR